MMTKKEIVWTRCGEEVREEGLTSTSTKTTITTSIAHYCDMPGNDLGAALVASSSQQCARECARAAECSHFVWTGTGTKCQLKRGQAQKSQARLVSDQPLSVCGLVMRKKGLLHTYTDIRTLANNTFFECWQSTQSLS